MTVRRSLSVRHIILFIGGGEIQCAEDMFNIIFTSISHGNFESEDKLLVERSLQIVKYSTSTK
jgi:hypothetical protein